MIKEAEVRQKIKEIEDDLNKRFEIMEIEKGINEKTEEVRELYSQARRKHQECLILLNRRNALTGGITE